LIGLEKKLVSLGALKPSEPYDFFRISSGLWLWKQGKKAMKEVVTIKWRVGMKARSFIDE
jgi:hypothetical protein